MPDASTLFPHLSVFENVAFGLRIRRLPREEVSPRVERTLDLVWLRGLENRLQQQRVALARALVYEPRVVLLDEPLSNLDAKLRVEMRTEIRGLQRRLGLTAIYVTHDQEEALSVSDRIAVMRSGRVEQLGTPAEVYHRPATPFVANFVGTSNLLEAEVMSGDAGGIRLDLGGGLRLRAIGHPLPAGRRVWIVARPETLTIEPGGATAHADRLVGKVVGVTLLGSVVRVRVEVAPETTVVVDVPNTGTTPGFAEGDVVGVGVNPERLGLLPRE